MTPERWRDAERLFQRAVDLPPSSRGAFLADECGGDTELCDAVVALLAQDDAGGDDVSAVVGAAAALWARSEVPAEGVRIGRYRTTGVIGQGGMGTVYSAVRDDEFTQDVAIKVIKRGMDTEAIVQRFRTERQILATLAHPNIARLLDGGTTGDGLPFFVMERVDGRPVVDYCREHALSLEQRLDLFRTICGAVEYAHRNLVVHRDLKPSNILVAVNGTPKLLDFGIAKLLGSDPQAQATLTVSEMRAFTPDYGSPEQVRGEAVTTTTDVYSLGTILYEMLTGQRAHRVREYTPVGVQAAVCDDVIVPPSRAATDRALARQLKGDLDNIVLRALQKEPDRRYQTVAELADDVRCYLAHLPVRARADSTLYRAGKFWRRHRGAIAATAAVCLALLGGGIVALQQARVARARELQVRGLARVFLFDVHDAIRNLPGATSARQTIVETAVRYLDALAGSEPRETELLRELAAGYRRVGDIQGNDNQGGNLGNLEAALRNYHLAIGFLDRIVAAEPGDRRASIDRVSVKRQIADIEFNHVGVEQGRAGMAAALGDARALVRSLPGDDEARRLLADLLMALGQRERRAGNLAESFDLISESLALLGTLTGNPATERDVRDLLVSGEAAIGMTAAQLDRLDEALAHYQRAVEETGRLLEREPRNVDLRRAQAINYSHVGDVLGNPELPNLGDPAGAERAFRQQVEIARQLAEADAHDVRAQTDHAIALMRLGMVVPVSRLDEKIDALRGARALMARLTAESSSNVGVRANLAAIERQLGDALRDGGRPADAAGHYRQAMTLTEPIMEAAGAPPRTFAMAAASLAVLEAERGQPREALSLMARATAVAETIAAREQADDVVTARALTARVYGLSSRMHGRLGRDDEAARLRERALGVWVNISTKAGFTSNLRKEMERFRGA